MWLLLASAARAWTYFGLSLGGAGGSGELQAVPYHSLAVAGTASVNWRGGPLEGWVGLFGSGLMAADRWGTFPAAPVMFEAGFGGGVPALNAGIYFGGGLGGDEAGLYLRGMAPGSSWASRFGGELRAFYLPASNMGVLALLARVELGDGEPPRRRRVPPPPPPPPPVHHDDPYGA
jgi:hypothetical protein